MGPHVSEQPGVVLFWDPLHQNKHFGGWIGMGDFWKAVACRAARNELLQGDWDESNGLSVLQKAIATAPVVLVGGAGLINC